MWRLQACSLEKTYLITGSQQQSWPTNSLLKEIPPTVSSNLCSFWDELKKNKRRKEGKQNKYFVEKILRHYRKSFGVVMETQKAQARKKKSE